jgi:3-oxoadipate enol-lactonase
MPTCHVADASIHYREAGYGNEVVLLLHAFPLHSGMWGRQLSALAPRFRVIAPDVRGFGETTVGPAATTMELVANDVLGLLTQLGIRRAAVAGLSMGGYVALELYRRAPAIFRGLALCDTKAPADTVEQRAGRETFALNALAKGLDFVADDFVPKLLRPEPSPAVEAEVRHLIADSTPAGVAAAQRGMARRVDSVPTLARIDCPTLAIFGELDRITPFGELVRIAQTVRGARLTTIPGAGHLANLEAPTAFNTALEGFLSSLARS